MRRPAPGALAALLLLAAPLAARAQATRAMPADARAMIVKILSTADSSSTPEPGSGVLVGVTADSFFIATARHVVGTLRRNHQDVLVSFAWDTAVSVPAAIRHKGPDGLDLAVVTVPRSRVRARPGGLPDLDRLGDVRRLRYGDPVRPAGCPQGECWSPPLDPDKVVGLDQQGVIIETRSVQPGSSGGGLFDAWWELVGLVVEKASPRAGALTIDRVMSQLAFWRVPVQLRRPSVPRAGYRTTIGVSVFTSTPLGFDRLPAGRATLVRRTSSTVAWHVGFSRFAPPNLGINAATAGVGLLLRPTNRLSFHPFVEVGIASVEGRYDNGGYYIATGTGPQYVPLWKRVRGNSTGSGVALAVDYIVLPGIIGEVTVGRWSFPTPEPLASFGKFQVGIGVRRGS